MTERTTDDNIEEMMQHLHTAKSSDKEITSSDELKTDCPNCQKPRTKRKIKTVKSVTGYASDGWQKQKLEKLCPMCGADQSLPSHAALNLTDTGKQNQLGEDLYIVSKNGTYHVIHEGIEALCGYTSANRKEATVPLERVCNECLKEVGIK